MECFNHPGVNAVAACKHCVKALCRECVHEAEGGVSCGGRCAEEVAQQHASQRAARTTLGAAGAAVRTSAYFVMALGAAMLVLGVADEFILGQVMGGMLLGFGVIRLVGARKYSRG